MTKSKKPRKKQSGQRVWKAWAHLKPNGYLVRYDSEDYVIEYRQPSSSYEDCKVIPVQIKELRRRG